MGELFIIAQIMQSWEEHGDVTGIGIPAIRIVLAEAEAERRRRRRRVRRFAMRRTAGRGMAAAGRAVRAMPGCRVCRV